MRWQLQTAKQRFSEVVRRALADEPQIVTRHGEEVVVVVAAREFRRLQGGDPDFKRVLQDAPDLSLLEVRRDPAPAPRVTLHR